MTNADPNTGAPPSQAGGMAEAEIVRIATADYQTAGRMREQADGWERAAKLARHAEEMIRTKRESYLVGEARALNFVNEQLELMEANATSAAEAADSQATAMRENADEAERFYSRVQELKGDAEDMDNMDTKDRKQLFAESGDSSFGAHRDAILEEMRAELETSETNYRSTFSSYATQPPEYEGLSKWAGDSPVRVPGTTPISNDPEYSGGNSTTGFGYSARQGSGTGAGVTAPAPPQTDGPQLQNPGITPSPNPTATPNPGSAPPPGGGNSGFVPPPTGGGQPSGSRAVTPPAPRPSGSGTSTAARATPALNPNNRPMANPPSRVGNSGGIPPRSTGPQGMRPNGIPGGGPSKAERAALPNQRGKGNAAGRNVQAPRPSARPPVSTGNSAFRPNRRAVPSVIGQRGNANPTSSSQTRADGPSRAGGRVAFGERPNKGKQPLDKPLNPVRGGRLTRNGIVTNRPRVRQYTNAPAPRSGGLQQGKVFGERASKSKPEADTVEQQRKRRREWLSKQRSEILETYRARKAHEAGNPLSDGLDGTVVPPVVRPQPRPGQVSRDDVGPIFGARGWES